MLIEDPSNTPNSTKTFTGAILFALCHFVLPSGFFTTEFPSGLKVAVYIPDLSHVGIFTAIGPKYPKYSCLPSEDLTSIYVYVIPSFMILSPTFGPDSVGVAGASVFSAPTVGVAWFAIAVGASGVNSIIDVAGAVTVCCGAQEHIARTKVRRKAVLFM